MAAARSVPALLERLGARYPIILAPMFGSSGPELQAAVANAGGCALFPGGNLPAAVLRSGLRAAREALLPSAAPLGVNIWAPAMVQDKSAWSRDQAEAAAEAARRQGVAMDELAGPGHAQAVLQAAPPTPSDCEAVLRGQVDVLLEEEVRVVSVHFGWLPPDEIKRLREAGVFLIGNATNAQEARTLEKEGACAIIAQGKEAGGHRGTFLDMAGYRENAMLRTVDLVREVRAAVSLPIIAAGGIMDGADVRAVLDVGAQAAQMGTAFLTAEESLVHAEHRRALLSSEGAGDSGAAPTVVTQGFTGKPARALANKWTASMRDIEGRLPNCFNGLPGGRPLGGAAAKASRADMMIMWAGEEFQRCRALPASQLLAAVVAEASLQGQGSTTASSL